MQILKAELLLIVQSEQSQRQQAWTTTMWSWVLLKSNVKQAMNRQWAKAWRFTWKALDGKSKANRRSLPARSTQAKNSASSSINVVGGTVKELSQTSVVITWLPSCRQIRMTHKRIGKCSTFGILPMGA